MAQTKKKRKRKHRGTPAGTVTRSASPARPRTREDAKKVAADRRAERLDRKPTWRGAINRAAIAALVFFGLLLLLFGRSLEEAVPLLLLMFLLYIPLGYMTDKAIYNFRQRRKRR